MDSDELISPSIMETESSLIDFKRNRFNDLLKERNGVVLKEIADYLLDGITDVNDLNIAIIRVELLCHLLCVPLSNAYGIHARNVFDELNIILRKVIRAACFEFNIRRKNKGLSKTNKLKSDVKKDDSDAAWDAIDEDIGENSQSQSESQATASNNTAEVVVLPRCQVLCDLFDAMSELAKK
jgi:hypothetical protein